MMMMMSMFWVLAQCRLGGIYHSYLGTYCFFIFNREVFLFWYSTKSFGTTNYGVVLLETHSYFSNSGSTLILKQLCCSNFSERLARSSVRVVATEKLARNSFFLFSMSGRITMPLYTQIISCSLRGIKILLLSFKYQSLETLLSVFFFTFSSNAVTNKISKVRV
jgi:hypothetical protein